MQENIVQICEVKIFEKFLRAKREESDLRFANFGKTFKSFDRETFWLKGRKNTVGERISSPT